MLARSYFVFENVHGVASQQKSLINYTMLTEVHFSVVANKLKHMRRCININIMHQSFKTPTPTGTESTER